MPKYPFEELEAAWSSICECVLPDSPNSSKRRRREDKNGITTHQMPHTAHGIDAHTKQFYAMLEAFVKAGLMRIVRNLYKLHRGDIIQVRQHAIGKDEALLHAINFLLYSATRRPNRELHVKNASEYYGEVPILDEWFHDMIAHHTSIYKPEETTPWAEYTGTIDHTPPAKRCLLGIRHE